MPGPNTSETPQEISRRELDELLRRAAESVHTAAQEPDTREPSRRGSNFTWVTPARQDGASFCPPPAG